MAIYLLGLLIIPTVIFIFWQLCVETSKKPYKIVTNGKEYRIKYPYGTIGCASYRSVEEAKETIERYQQDDFKKIEDKKIKWEEVKTTQL